MRSFRNEDDDCGCGDDPLCKCKDGKKEFPKIPTHG